MKRALRKSRSDIRVDSSNTDLDERIEFCKAVISNERAAMNAVTSIEPDESAGISTEKRD